MSRAPLLRPGACGIGPRGAIKAKSIMITIRFAALLRRLTCWLGGVLKRNDVVQLSNTRGNNNKHARAERSTESKSSCRCDNYVQLRLWPRPSPTVRLGFSEFHRLP